MPCLRLSVQDLTSGMLLHAACGLSALCYIFGSSLQKKQAEKMKAITEVEWVLRRSQGVELQVRGQGSSWVKNWD